MHRRSLLMLLLAACSTHDAGPSSADAGPTSRCVDPGAPLSGTTYDITRSRFAFGSTPVMQTANPSTKLPDWCADPFALTNHFREYFIHLSRSVQGIPIVDSRAFARMNTHDQSTLEGLFWPTIPADTVAAAAALRDQLAQPAALAAYRAKLPPEAQGAGSVVIHHSAIALRPDPPFLTAATWDVIANSSIASFDSDGARVNGPW